MENKKSKLDIIDEVVEYLEEDLLNAYGTMEVYTYQNNVIALEQLRDYRNGYIQEFNNMGTTARCLFSDIVADLELAEDWENIIESEDV